MVRLALPPRSSRLWDALSLVVFVAAISVLGGCKSIPEGHSAVNRVTVRGSDKVDDDDIRDKMATTESTKFLMLFRGILFEYSLFDRFVFQRDLARVESFYRSKGYYDVHARAGRVFQIDANHVRVEVIVEEGPPVLVHTMHVDGLDGLPKIVVDAANKAATDGLPLEKEFVEEEFKKTEGSVRRALSDRGYAYAKVRSDAAVDIVTHRVDVVMTVTPGPKCVFGEIRIEGLGPLPDKQVRATIDIKPGKEYSEKDLDDAQQALLDLGVFASVELKPDIPGTPEPPPHKPGKSDEEQLGNKDANGEQGKGTGTPGQGGPPLPPGPPVVPVLVKLEPSRLHTLRLGGGIEFDALKTDVHGLIGWESKNFFGGLRTFSVEFRPGIVPYPLRVNNLVAPNKFLPEEHLRLDFGQPSFLEARTKGFIRPEFNVYPVLINPNPLPNASVIGYGEFRDAIGLERGIWKFFGSLSYNDQIAYPFSYVANRDPNLSLIVISYPELYTTFDFRDDKIHPSKGIFLGNTLQVAGLGGNATDIKVQPEVRGYIPLYKKKLVLATRGTVGLIEAPNYGNVVETGPKNGNLGPDPAAATKDYQLTFFRGFFSGGPNGNRGYPIRGVGPYDIVPFLTPQTEAGQINAECRNTSTGALVVDERCRSPTGGFTLFELSGELRYVVSGPLSVAAFCDSSDVSPRPNNLRFDHLHLSCGGGGRYDTPAGPIRLDVGYRIPGMQVLGGLTPDEREPDRLLGIPIAVHIGIGEAY
ncbi:MAG: outer membrane protein assembly factor YaeT precursor [Myxococcaceae bacterium]|jgi:outer membrane protein insertion porin family/translocation and assembly module TamA|nr:outer membrane protein assembly factor YaeT precursor [Myxococcaceae bacterium]